MNLFEKERDLEYYLFRITDNGGESYDRITVAFSDGDYVPCSALSRCASGEGIDPQYMADDVEAGTQRDLRWIDLDADLRRSILNWLNEGFADWLGSFVPPETRDKAQDSRSPHNRSEWAGVGVYGVPGAYMVRVEAWPEDDASGDAGPFDTLAAAVRYTLPDCHDMAGEEYHSTVDLWDETDGPKPLWDRETDPPQIDPDNEQARFVIIDTTALNPDESTGRVAYFATEEDAVNFLGHSATIDPDKLNEGLYHIDPLEPED